MTGKEIKIGEGKKYDVTQISSEGISKEERAAIEKKNRKTIDIFKAFDHDGSGDLNKVELAHAMSIFGSFDDNKDGKLSKSELENAARVFEEAGYDVEGKDLKSFMKFVQKTTKKDSKEDTSEVIAQDEEAKRAALKKQVESDANKIGYKPLEGQEGIYHNEKNNAFVAYDGDAKTLVSVKFDEEKNTWVKTGEEVKDFVKLENDAIEARKKQEAEELKRQEQQKEAEKARQKDLNTPKNYTVQLNETVDAIVRKSMKARGIEITKENLAKERAEFLADNADSIHGKKGSEYFYAGATIKVKGNLENKDNALEVEKAYKALTAPKEHTEVETILGRSLINTIDKNGKRTQTIEKDPDGNIVNTMEYTYDEKGNNTQTIEKDKDGNIVKTLENTYDEKGNNTQTIEKDPDGNIVNTMEYTYDEKGELTQTIIKDSDGSASTLIYDEKGNTTQIIEKDPDGNIVKTYEYTFDENGNELGKPRVTDVKAQRLTQSLQDLSPANRPTNVGVLGYASSLEKKVDENTELMEKIAKGDDPAFAAKALLAASKGTGTNEALFEAVINAKDDISYYHAINRELNKYGVGLGNLARSEYMLSAGRDVSKNESFRKYLISSLSDSSAALRQANKLGYRRTDLNGTFYDDKTKTHYRYDTETKEFYKVDADKVYKDGTYEKDGKVYNPDGTEKV